MINFKQLFQNNSQTHHYIYKYQIHLVMLELYLKIWESNLDRL
jgi:hypothetical protein